MRKQLMRIVMIITVLILVSQVVWPTVIFAKETTITPDETGWYYFTKKDALDEAESNEGMVYYYSDDGKNTKLFPSRRIHYAELFDRGYWGNQVQFFLNSNIVYYYDNQFGELKKASSTIEESLETLASTAIYGLATGLHFLVSCTLGEVISIDDLVFNHFPETSIDFFEDNQLANPEKSTLIYGQNGTIGLRSVVNEWYSIFLKITVLGYLIILIYMGIRIVLSSTAQEKANFRRFMLDWCVGIALLFLFPYVMKHIIVLNNAFVKTIDENKGYVSAGPSYILESDVSQFANISIDDSIGWNKDGDYMSRMGYLAQRQGKIAFSVCFLVLTWQFITLVVHYFKRVFMIAFLITIYPLVVLSYAIDKIADGKSQAFDTWFKEFFLNVFVQSFHAIIYVFICSTIMSVSVTSGEKDPDYLLAIIGVMFLFQGEEIIRQIFGQVSGAGTMKSLGDESLKTFAGMKVATTAVKGAASVVIGEKSVFQKGRQAYNDLKSHNVRRAAFPYTATYTEPPNIGQRLPDAPEDPGHSGSLREKKNFENQQEINNSVAVLNNPKTHSLAEMIKSLEHLMKVTEKDPDNPALKQCHFNKSQIQAFAKLDEDIQRMMIAGKTDVEIQNHLDSQLGVILSSEPEDRRKIYEKMYKSHVHVTGPSSLVQREDVEREVDDTTQEVHRIQDSLNRIHWDSSKRAGYDSELDDFAEDMWNTYGDASMSDTEKEEFKKLARNIKEINSREAGTSHSRLWQATRSIKNVQDSFTTGTSKREIAMRRLLENELHEDIDVFAHVFGKHLVGEGEAEIASYARTVDEKNQARAAVRDAQTVVNEYESNVRDGYYDDEVSAHEVIVAMTTNRTEAVKDRIRFRTASTTMTPDKKKECTNKLNGYVFDICKEYYGGTSDSDGGATVEETNAVTCLAKLLCRDDGAHTEFELFNAAEVVQKKMEDSEEFRKIVEERLDENIDVIRRAISEKIVDNTGGDGKMIDTVEDDDIAQEIAKRAQKYVDDTASIAYDHTEEIIDKVYESRKKIVSDATSRVVEDYMVENEIDIYENHQNTNLLTQEGYTLEELNLMKKSAVLKNLSNFSPFGSSTNPNASRGLFDVFIKSSFLKEEEKRDHLRAKLEDRRKMYNPFVSSYEMAQERRKERDRNNNEHFTGDIGDVGRDKKKKKK